MPASLAWVCLAAALAQAPSPEFASQVERAAADPQEPFALRSLPD